MKKRIKLFLFLIVLFSALLLILKTISIVNQTQNYIYLYQRYASQNPDEIKDLMNSLIISYLYFLIYIPIVVFSIIVLFKLNRADLSELLSSTKEKRLAKKEAKRQEKLSELEAKKEEIEKTINDLKKE